MKFMLLLKERDFEEAEQEEPKEDDDDSAYSSEPFLQFIGDVGKRALEQDSDDGEYQRETQHEEDAAEEDAVVSSGFYIGFNLDSVFFPHVTPDDNHFSRG